MQSETVLSPADLAALWRQLGTDQSLTEPYELTEHGELVMSQRPTNRHQLVNTEVAIQIKSQLGGVVVVEPAVLTTAGVRVPDVAWMPAERWDMASELLESPDLVVEFLSPGNRKAQLRHKIEAYLTSGVREVLVVGLKGTMEFHRDDGAHRRSAFELELQLAPELFA